MKLLDYINEKSNNTYKDFKLVSVIFDEKNKSLVFKFLYKDEMLSEQKEELQRLVTDYISNDVEIIIKCKKAYVDCDLVKDVIYNFIFRHYASVGVDFTKDNLDVFIDDSIHLTINCNEFQYKYFSSNIIKNDILSYADGFFFEPFELNLNLCNTAVSEEIIDNPFIDLTIGDNSNALKYVKIDNLHNYIGEVVGVPIDISSIKGVMENIEIVGTLKFLNEKSFESKRKDKNGEAIIKTYYSFIISDSLNNKVSCVYFPNKSDSAKAVGLQEGNTYLLHGSVEEFNGRTNFKVKAIGTCDIINTPVEEVEEVIEYKNVNDNYLCIKPEPHVEIFQDNLFAVTEEVGKYLIDNDVVVFDIETTGLDASKCEIIEIGAVKIHNGKISETFETLIKPSVPIPDEIVDLTGITDDMVVNAPSIKQVIPDFYKFCYGTTIIAYNIDFDYKFINIHGKKCGYLFDMKQIDALYLARAFIPGLKNFKLGTVCKKLGVSLENAHRAVHDAMATAEVVIKLSTNIE